MDVGKAMKSMVMYTQQAQTKTICVYTCHGYSILRNTPRWDHHDEASQVSTGTTALRPEGSTYRLHRLQHLRLRLW